MSENQLRKEEKLMIKKILKKLGLSSEEYETLVDIGTLTGDDLSDLWRRKFVADIVIARKLQWLENFMNFFNYKSRRH